MNLEELRVAEKIKISYLRHAGSIADIVKDTGYDERYVRKMVAKFRKKDSRDVNVHISNNIMSIMMQGSDMRKVRAMDMIKKIEGSEKMLRSICCQSSFDYIQDSWEDRYVCKKCNKICNVEFFIKPVIFDLYMKLLTLLREEDLTVLQAAEKMGYTNAERQPNVIVQQDNRTLILNEKEEVALKDYNALPPLDREKIIQKIENVLMEETKKRIENEE